MTWQEKCFILWGESWKATLAKTADVNRRSVQKWASVFNPEDCPDTVESKINETFTIWIEE